MDHTQRPDALTDEEQQVIAAIDERLRAALAVEPSPGFEMRVRSRIRGSGVPGFRSSGVLGFRGSAWWVGAAVAAGVMLAVMVALMNRTEERAVPAVAVSPAPSLAPAPVRPVLPATPASPKLAQVPASEGGPKLAQVLASEGGRPRAARPEAQVQVAPGQEEALRRFVALVNQGHLDPASVLAENPAALQDVPLIESTIVPVTIAPLFPAPAGERADGPTVKEE